MQKIYVLFLLFSAGFSTFSAHAQTDFRSGYIVRPAGDTVHGEIDYRDARFNASTCRFRPAAPGATEIFLPGQLQGYGLSRENKKYRSLPWPPPTNTGGTTPAYFFEALVSGPANLYFVRDNERVDHYFVATATYPLTELVYRKVRVEREGKVLLEEQNIFRTTLGQALPDCAVAQSKLPNLSFTEGDLIRLVTSYNLCQTTSSTARAAPDVVRVKQRPHLGLLLGVKQTRFTLNGNNNFYNNLQFGPHTAPVAGIAINLPLEQFSRKLSLEIDLFYEMQKYNQQFETHPFPDYLPTRLIKFDLASVRLPVLVRYTFPRGRFRPLLEAGPTLAYAVKATNSISQTISTGQLGPEHPIFASSGGLNYLEEGVCLGVGMQAEVWQKRRITWLARYEVSSGCSGVSSINTRVNRVYGLIALDLFN